MLFNTLAVVALAAVVDAQTSSTPHAQGSVGSVMGPVQFLWPEDRPWSANADNTAPCGSTSGVNNRTQFPLDNGAVSLSIGETAYQVAFRIAYDNNPTIQSAFSEQIVHNVTEVDPGHQCYRIPDRPDNIAAGTNATIQLEYWSTYQSEPSQSFYACADVTLVEASSFVGSIPCFNVTSSEFVAPASSSTAASVPAATAPSTVSAPEISSSKSSGLSAGAKAGIAVGVVVGVAALLGALLFALFRKRAASKKDAEAANQFPVMRQKERAASLASAETQVQH
ncbi:hypothetical protein BJ875DRAFT_391665 [Amylocarpus encephaloides]|uniref:Copper acquisition factor BIM1-like domain-containing protein n=1 Tax=Amylocarpus encephaloides TaxID=45428 RepID=A0A9P8C9W9_9HELO|nr:hypothetical protein BJ875DRAFT_391665 [Amylocarpus encephaloides]